MRRINRIIILLLCVVVFIAFIFNQRTLANSNQVGGSTEISSTYAISSSIGAPFQMAIESISVPNIIWFTVPEKDLIGELIITSPSNFTVNSYPVSANGEPYDIVFDGVDKMWFTLAGTNKIGNIDVNTNVVTEFAIPSGDTPHGISIAPDGTIWIAQSGNNTVTSFTETGSVFEDYIYTSSNGQPEEIEVLDNDTIWVSLPGVNRIAKLTPSDPSYSNVPLQLIPGQATFAPTGLVLDGSEPWASSSDMSVIGRHAPGTLSFWIWFQLEITDFAPTRLDFQDETDANFVWFIDSTNGFAGHLQTDNNGVLEGFRYTAFPEGGDANPTDIVVDANGTVWVVKNGTGEIFKWNPPYFDLIYLPLILNS